MESSAGRHVSFIYPNKARVRYWLSLLGLYAFTLLVIVTINFFLPRLMPGDPLLALIDPESGLAISKEEIRIQLARYYGLDRPLPDQYLAYLGNLVKGNLGWSISFNAPVSNIINTHLVWTLRLMIPAVLLGTFISLFAGVHAGWRRNKPADRGLLAAFLLLDTTPVFLVGALLLLLFSARLEWFPQAGGRTPFASFPTKIDEIFDLIKHMVLPLTAVTLSLAGRNFLLMRSSMINVLGEDFMLVARGKGLSEADQKYRHAMRNSLLPVVTRFSMQMGSAITGMILIETLFAYPGMGRLMFNAVAARDYPVLQGCFLVAALAVVLANFLAEMSYAWLDPRTREKA
jgi:peptide/nickel transport system permease protein